MSDKMVFKIHSDPKIIVKFGSQGIKGDSGITIHSELTNLNYASAGHTGFQSKLVYDADYGAFEVVDD